MVPTNLKWLTVGATLLYVDAMPCCPKVEVIAIKKRVKIRILDGDRHGVESWVPWTSLTYLPK